jgi:formylglycine-generating enzyme required for sulfatase activity
MALRGAAAVLLGFVFSACSTSPCNPETVLLEYTLSGGAEAATTIDVTLTIGAAQSHTMKVQRRTRAASGSIEVDFGVYPKGQSITLTLTARRDDDVSLASASATTTAMAGCTILMFKLKGSTPDLGAPDLGVPDLGVADMAITIPGMIADMAVIPIPHCRGLAANCGAGADGGCCNSSVVSGGTFLRGYDVASDKLYSDNSHSATVGEFRLDKYEITVARFRAFVRAGMGTRANPPHAGAGANPRLAASGWDPSWNVNLMADTPSLVAALACPQTVWTDDRGANENRPMSCISWFEAFAFCAWDEGFLPTDAEWQFAASGGAEQRAYPWSDPFASTVIDESYAVFESVQGSRNVGTLSIGDGKWGQSDLAGNVWEWVLDWYADYTSPCVDCAALSGGTERAFRGGGFENVSVVLRAANRVGTHDLPIKRGPDIGARCARSR